MDYQQIFNTLPAGVLAGVMEDLPLVSQIRDEQLREKTIKAWAFALVSNGYEKVSDLPGSGMPGAPVIGNQSSHINYVAQTALNMKKNLEANLGISFNLSDDILLACGICHDVGKPFEYNKQKRSEWEADPSVSGLPAVRHPAYGVFVSMIAGLPDEIVHVCAAHSPEGRFVKRSMAATLVHYADDSYWFGLESSGKLEGSVPKL